MIEPTDEMAEAFFAADRAHRRSELERLGFHGAHLPTMNVGAFRAGLAAVLAIVERDLPRCPYVEWGFKVRLCSLPFGHDGKHDLADRVIA